MLVVAVVFLDETIVELGGDGAKVGNNDLAGGSSSSSSWRGSLARSRPNLLEGHGEGVPGIDLLQGEATGTAVGDAWVGSDLGVSGVKVVAAGGQGHLPGPACYLGADEGQVDVGVDGDGRRGAATGRRGSHAPGTFQDGALGHVLVPLPFEADAMLEASVAAASRSWGLVVVIAGGGRGQIVIGRRCRQSGRQK